MNVKVMPQSSRSQEETGGQQFLEWLAVNHRDTKTNIVEKQN